MRSTRQFRTQLEAAYTLMSGDTTTGEKLDKIKILLTGINPQFDQKLELLFKNYHHLSSAVQGDIIHLSTQGLPETTEADRKRKKALVVFVTSWKSLKSEVVKVQGYYDQSLENSSAAVASVAKTGLFAKGPFGLITVAAVVIVGVGLLLRQATTTVNIQNIGCPPLLVPKLAVKIPGPTLPETPIVAGTSQSATPQCRRDYSCYQYHLTATAFDQTASYSFPSGSPMFASTMSHS